MTNRSVLYELNIDLDSKSWGVSCPIDQMLIGPVSYGWDRFKQDPNSMTFGGGLLSGSPLPGTRRMIFCGYSPQWEGFYVSALGGAMYIMRRVGINYVWLRGRCSEVSVIIIRLRNNEYDVRIEPIAEDVIWNGYVDESGRTWGGFYAMQQAIFEKYRHEFSEDSVRVLAVGPASKYTASGAIGSNYIKNNKISDIDDWAGRGGLGSRLFQYHRVAGVIFGGDWQDPAMKEGKELDQYFLDHFGVRAIQADMILSQKYRYVPEFETGGTFGVNMLTAEDKLLSFNYMSIYQGDDQRNNLHNQFILQHYLKQFNDEIIIPRKFSHCGEPCAIACKKYYQEYKKDYEPYAILGPNCGIFDQRAAERLNKYVDTLGMDSIQAGGMVAWIMELISAELIEPTDFGLPERKPVIRFPYNLEHFDVIRDSEWNSDYAIAILQMILYSPDGDPFRKGIRYAAKFLDEKYHINSLERAVFLSFGENGCMVPNQYWVPGMFAPMPLMGKYFSYYEGQFLSPYELGRKNVERFVYELYSENSGSCRFHRKWVEDIIDEIILSHFDLDFNYWKMNFDLANEIHNYQSAQAIFWENERIVDIIQGFLEKWKRVGLQDTNLEYWISLFQADKWSAAKSFWDEMIRGMNDAFANGITEPPHKEHGNLVDKRK